MRQVINRKDRVGINRKALLRLKTTKYEAKNTAKCFDGRMKSILFDITLWLAFFS